MIFLKRKQKFITYWDMCKQSYTYDILKSHNGFFFLFRIERIDKSSWFFHFSLPSLVQKVSLFITQSEM